jgi:hypothetical protein
MYQFDQNPSTCLYALEDGCYTHPDGYYDDIILLLYRNESELTMTRRFLRSKSLLEALHGHKINRM